MPTDKPLPDDAVVGIAPEDYEFIRRYTEGEVSEEEFNARYRQPDGRIAIPVRLLDPGTPDASR